MMAQPPYAAQAMTRDSSVSGACRIEPLSATIGAEVHDVELSRTLDDDSFGAIRAAFHRLELKTDGHRTFTSHVLGDNGGWRRIMTATYRRKK